MQLKAVLTPARQPPRSAYISRKETEPSLSAIYRSKPGISASTDRTVMIGAEQELLPCPLCLRLKGANKRVHACFVSQAVRRQENTRPAQHLLLTKSARRRPFPPFDGKRDRAPGKVCLAVPLPMVHQLHRGKWEVVT